MDNYADRAPAKFVPAVNADAELSTASRGFRANILGGGFSGYELGRRYRYVAKTAPTWFSRMVEEAAEFDHRTGGTTWLAVRKVGSAGKAQFFGPAGRTEAEQTEITAALVAAMQERRADENAALAARVAAREAELAAMAAREHDRRIAAAKTGNGYCPRASGSEWLPRQCETKSAYESAAVFVDVLGARDAHRQAQRDAAARPVIATTNTNPFAALAALKVTA
jgi:hypothetical protein